MPPTSGDLFYLDIYLNGVEAVKCQILSMFECENSAYEYIALMPVDNLHELGIKVGEPVVLFYRYFHTEDDGLQLSDIDNDTELIDVREAFYARLLDSIYYEEPEEETLYETAELESIDEDLIVMIPCVHGAGMRRGMKILTFEDNNRSYIAVKPLERITEDEQGTFLLYRYKVLTPSEAPGGRDEIELIVINSELEYGNARAKFETIFQELIDGLNSQADENNGEHT